MNTVPLIAIALINRIFGPHVELGNGRTWHPLSTILFGAVVWIALMLGACSSAPPIPDLQVTDATIQGSAHVAGTIGPVPWSVSAEGSETGGKVCVTVWVFERCEVVE